MSLQYIETQPGLGLEEVSTEAFAILVVNLNDEIAKIESSKQEADERVAELRGLEYISVDLERVEDSNFHLGNTPSLIADDYDNLPDIELFPSVSVMAYRALPDPTSASFDQGAVYRNSMYIETIVKSSEDEGQDVCNKRIWRTTNAVVNVIDSNRNLNGIISGLDDPTILISEVFSRPESDFNPENTWYWQAARIEYPVRKNSPYVF